MESKIAIVGCGGHARSVASVFLNASHDRSVVFYDKNAAENEVILNQPTTKITDYENLVFENPFIIAVGENKSREVIYKALAANNHNQVTVISKVATIGLGAKIGSGSFLADFSHLGPEVEIGISTIINTGAIIEHESKVGDFTHIAPGSVVCGRCKIGNHVFIGAGSTIIDKISICSEVMIGAGSTVTQNITEPGTYVGTPAKKIK